MDKVIGIFVLIIYLAMLAVLARNWQGVGTAINNTFGGFANLISTAKA